jgi:cell division protein FtsQ
MARKRANRPQRGRTPRQELRLSDWLSGLMALVLIGALLGGAGWGFFLLKDPGTFPLRVVGIDGDLRYLQRQDLERTVAGLVREGFFTVNPEAVRQAAEALAWVDRASVRRVWPDTLLIRVQEQVPLARWGEDALVNPRGEVFTPESGPELEKLTQLAGPEGSAPKIVVRYRELKQRLHSTGLEIQRLRLNDRDAWTLVCGNGLKIMLGNRGAKERLDRFIRVYPLLQRGEKALQQVDLRYTNGFAVRWKQKKGDTGSEAAQVPTAAAPDDGGLA